MAKKRFLFRRDHPTSCARRTCLALKAAPSPRSCVEWGVTEQTYFRFGAREYGGLKIDQARRLKDLEQENARLPAERRLRQHHPDYTRSCARSARETSGPAHAVGTRLRTCAIGSDIPSGGSTGRFTSRALRYVTHRNLGTTRHR